MALLRALPLAVAVALGAPAAAWGRLAVEAVAAQTVTEQGTPDGVLAPGDGFELTQPVLSSEPALTTVFGRLASSTPGVTVTRSGSPYPDAAFGATVSNSTPFTVSIGADVPCGTRLAFDLQVSADQGAADLPLSVGTGLAGPLRPYDAADVPRAIPDGSSIVSSFEVATPGLVKDLRVRIGQITHDYVGDLKLSLEAPDGTTVVLADGVGGSGDNFTDTVFSAGAGTSIAAAAAPFTGTFRPQGDLRAFEGRQQQGVWKLRVADTTLANTGTLVRWGADIAPAVCSGNPIPSFTATPDPVAPGATVTLDAGGSIDPSVGGSIVSYEWDLDGDGTYETNAGAATTQAASWPSKRTVAVGLRVTDNDGKSETVTVPVRVTLPPTAALAASPAAPATGETVTFDASAAADPDGTIAAYAWDLDGDGTFERSTGTAQTVTTAFATPGAHTVRVRVTDDTGATAVARLDVTAANRGPVAALTVLGSPVPGQPATLDAGASADPDGTIVSYEWDLDGDGTYETSTGPGSSTTRIFAAAGSYPVGVRVTDDLGAAATAAATVVVRDPPALPPPSPAPPGTGDTAGTGATAGGTYPGTGGATGAGPTGGAGGTGGVPSSPAAFTAALLGPPIQALRLARTKGLSLRCRVSGGARCSLTVYLPAAAARRLGLAPGRRGRVRPRAIGHVLLAADPLRPALARVVLSAPARRALRRARRVRVVVRGGATDALGRRVALSRVVLLRR